MKTTMIRGYESWKHIHYKFSSCPFLYIELQNGDVMEHIRNILKHLCSPMEKWEILYLVSCLRMGETVNCPSVFTICIFELEKKVRNVGVTNDMK